MATPAQPQTWMCGRRKSRKRLSVSRCLKGLRSRRSRIDAPAFSPRGPNYSYGCRTDRIEIQTGIDGVKFSECYPRRVTVELGGLPVHFISLSDLKANKSASGRNKDLAYLENLP